MPYVKVNDISLYYELQDEGDGGAEGEPLVLIMGLGTDISEWDGVIRWHWRCSIRRASKSLFWSQRQRELSRAGGGTSTACYPACPSSGASILSRVTHSRDNSRRHPHSIIQANYTS